MDNFAYFKFGLAIANLLFVRLVLPWLRVQTFGSLVLGGNFIVLLVAGYSQFCVQHMHQNVVETQQLYYKVVIDLQLLSNIQQNMVNIVTKSL